MYKAHELAKILSSDVGFLSNIDSEIEFITMDTRKVQDPKKTLFFALRGSLHDGHNFVKSAIDKGIKNIVVEIDYQPLHEGINYFPVIDSLRAMQTLAAFHRSSFRSLQVIGITGSNGKTTIKEWLYQLIQGSTVVKSPKSYNSQTGVALSLWQIRPGDELGIFEAGISTSGEMVHLAEMINPDIGLFTQIGDAHAEGFASIEQKLEEKLILFKDCPVIIYEEDQLMISNKIKSLYSNKTLWSWGKSIDATLFRIMDIRRSKYQTDVTILSKENSFYINIPFTDSASIHNTMHCIAVMMVLGISMDEISQGITKLHNIPMRLEMKNGIHQSILVNDTYNADLQSFKIALEFLSQQSGIKEKVVILSDFKQTGISADQLNHQLSVLIQSHDIKHVVGVGSDIFQMEKYLDPFILFSHFLTTEDLLAGLPNIDIKNKAVLIKGARVFQLEKVVLALSDKAHTAILETDLQAVEHNMKIFSQMLSPKTGIIAVIKASAYGSGSEELARFLEFRKVAYLAVALIDEGIQLRDAGVNLPIIILNPDRNGVKDMVKYHLEPEVYSIEQLLEIATSTGIVSNVIINIHLKIDTGMHRLGFMPSDIDEMILILKENPSIHVKSIFSHLSSSEDPNDDDFTHLQVSKLLKMYDQISSKIGYAPARHILNSSGILRFPQYHFDMVRLGLGLYGIDSTNTIGEKLEKAHILKASVVQVKSLQSNDPVGYNRKGKVTKEGKIAVVNIGYADGLMRKAGNGHYSVQIQGKDFQIIGNICMDLTMIDIGDNEEIKAGDEVIIFGKTKPIEILAKACETIPYEILTRISPRIRRLYIHAG